jgi:hypothetical protein
VGICNDQSTTYLKRLGYNVVRHPREGIAPLDLIGKQNGETRWLGKIDKLITQPPATKPAPKKDLVAAGINGQQSSKLKIGVGANVLGTIVGAMGGNLGATISYTNARKLTFAFKDVLTDVIAPLDVGNYLRDGDVDAGNDVLAEYVLGNGELFVITEIVKSKSFGVIYEREDGVAASVDVPEIQGLVGGAVKLETASGSTSTVTYTGQTRLVFGFRCFEVGVLDGDLRLTTSEAGATPLAAGAENSEEKIAQESAILTDESAGLLELDMPG